jgi:hypothetical protein
MKGASRPSASSSSSRDVRQRKVDGNENGPGTSRGKLRWGPGSGFTRSGRRPNENDPGSGTSGRFGGHHSIPKLPVTDVHVQTRTMNRRFAPVVPGTCPKISGKCPNQDSTASPSKNGASTARRSPSRYSTKARHAGRNTQRSFS